MTDDAKKTFTVRFPPDLHKLLAHIALERGESLGDLIIRVTNEWAASQPETAKYGKVATPKPSKPGPKNSKKKA